MNKKNIVLGLVLSTSLVLGQNTLAHADETTVEAIGIDSTKENHTEFDWNALPDKKYPLEIEDWDTEETRDVDIDESTTSIEHTEDEEIFDKGDESHKEKAKLRTNNDGNLELIQLYDTDLEINWLDDKGEGKVDGMVYWDANKGFSVDFNSDSVNELPHDGELNPETNLPYRNRTPKFYIDGKPAKAGDVLIEDPKTKELVFNIDQLGNAGYTLVEVDGKLYTVSELETDAINGTKISFKALEKDGETHTDGPLPTQDEWYDTETEDINLGYEIIEDDSLEEGKVVIEKEPVIGKRVTRIKYTRKGGQVFAQLLETRELPSPKAEKGIKRIGTKKDTPLTPIEDAEDATTIDYKFEYTDFKEERIANPELKVGEERIIQVGSAGYTLYKVVLDGNGKEISREKVAERMAQNHIVEYGTKEVEDDKCEFPLIPLTPAEEIEEDKCETPLIPLTPAEEIKESCENSLIPLIPTEEIEEVEIPTVDEKPVIVPEVESITEKNKEVDELIGEINEGIKEISNVLLENENNQKEVKDNKKENKKDIKDQDSIKEKPLEEGVKAIKVPKVNKNAKEVKTIKSATKASNPKTGIAGLTHITAILSASIIGLTASKKRK